MNTNTHWSCRQPLAAQISHGQKNEAFSPGLKEHVRAAACILSDSTADQKSIPCFRLSPSVRPPHPLAIHWNPPHFLPTLHSVRQASFFKTFNVKLFLHWKHWYIRKGLDVLNLRENYLDTGHEIFMYKWTRMVSVSLYWHDSRVKGDDVTSPFLCLYSTFTGV